MNKILYKLKKIFYKIRKIKIPFIDIAMYLLFINILYLVELKINENNTGIVLYNQHNDTLPLLNHYNSVLIFPE